MLHLTLEFAYKQLADVMGFVFTKSRLRTRYKSLFLVFSGELHNAIMSEQVSLTVENVFVENNIFGECFFLDVDGENDVFGNRLEFVLPRMMYLLDNNNFQTALYFKPFLHDDVFGEGFGEKRLFSGLAFFPEHWKDAFATYANACGCG